MERDFYYCTIYSFTFRVLGLGGWFWGVQFMWFSFNKLECVEGMLLIDFISFFLAMIYAAVYGTILTFVILCCPFHCDLYNYICKLFFCSILTSDSQLDATRGSEVNQSTTHVLISNLISRKFVNEFQSSKECPICCKEYTDQDDITPLPCHVSHYFHTDCLEEWLNNK